MTNAEMWPSGLRRRFAKPVKATKAFREFESRPLRQVIFYLTKPKEVCIICP